MSHEGCFERRHKRFFTEPPSFDWKFPRVFLQIIADPDTYLSDFIAVVTCSVSQHAFLQVEKPITMGQLSYAFENILKEMYAM